MRDVLDAATARIVAVAAHRRRTGRCPAMLHSLGTGESFRITPLADGFRDEAAAGEVRSENERLMLWDGRVLALRLDGDVGFSGDDAASGLRFTGRAGGGASVTVYGTADGTYFQYAVADDRADPAA